MFYSKETLFAEFEVAKSKDLKAGKGDENKVHTNRIQFCKDHVALKQTNPEYYDGVDVNFTNLLLATVVSIILVFTYYKFNKYLLSNQIIYDINYAGGPGGHVEHPQLH